MALVLLKNCASFCKLDNIIRATPPSIIQSALKNYDVTIRCSFTECTGIDTTDVAWNQVQLNLHRGFGLCSLVHHSPAAYIASLCNSIDISTLNHHLADAISQFNSHVPRSSLHAPLSISNLVCQHTVSEEVIRYVERSAVQLSP